MNGLLRAIDGLCSARDWDGLEDLADLCLQAVERGKQLWPIAAHIDYRLALEAPGDYAASVLDSDAGRFALGPLTEVAASTHRWDELAPYIEVPQAAAYVAQERVLRGEDLSDDRAIQADTLDLPLKLCDFEPTYALATFSARTVEVAEPWTPRAPVVSVDVRPAPEVRAAAITEVLLDLVQPWTAESNGAARAVVVEDDAIAAASTLSGPSALHMQSLEAEEALQRIAWAAASGGAHGRRRGAAFGRFMAFYTTAALAGLQWPVAPDRIGHTAGSLDWYRWDEGEPEEGWVFRLAVEDRAAGWAAAIGATDVKSPEEDG
ncbi:MAG TPA: DUF6183 family protein [Actinomycetota bacterium]|nr:DUF6183 family protein [Actinomycetota bacterium]